jgi:hypothetical protein
MSSFQLWAAKRFGLGLARQAGESDALAAGIVRPEKQ